MGVRPRIRGHSIIGRAMARVLYLFAEPKSVYDCTAYLCFMHYVLCSSALWRYRGRYVVNAWTRLYPLITAVSVTLNLARTLLGLFSDATRRDRIARVDRLLLSIALIDLVVSMACFVANVVLMQLNGRRLLQLYDRLDAIDRRLVREFGANLRYAKLLRKNVLSVSVLLLCYTATTASAVAQLGSTDVGLMIVIVLCYVVITASAHGTCYLLINQAEMLSIRFRLLQRLLDRAYLLRHFPDGRLRGRRLEAIAEMMLQLFDLIELMNRIYGYWMLMSMAHDLTQSTGVLYMLLGHKVADGGYRMQVFVTLCTLPPVYKLFVTPIYCDWALREGERCVQLFNQLDKAFPRSEHVRRLVDAMLLWRLRHKVQFQNALNLVLSNVTSMIVLSVIVNYLFILLQFHMTQEMGDQITDQTNQILNWIGNID